MKRPLGSAAYWVKTVDLVLANIANTVTTASIERVIRKIVLFCLRLDAFFRRAIIIYIFTISLFLLSCQGVKALGAMSISKSMLQLYAGSHYKYATK